MKYPKLLMALMGMEIGGAETHVLELCKELKKQGLDVYVASNGGAYEADLAAHGIVHCKVPMHSRKPHHFIYAYFALKKIIRDNDIRLVHAHARIPGFLCGLLQKKLRFRFVTTVHRDYSTAFPLGRLSDWGEQSLAVSEDLKTYLIDSYHIPAEKIRITVNGIDTATFAPGVDYSLLRSEFNLPEKKTRIVSISRLDADSSLAARLLVRSAVAINKAYPGTEIWIVGDGVEYDEIRSEAEAVNKQHGSLITMVGRRTDTHRWLGIADIFVGSSRSALEAMSSGKPVVHTGPQGYLGLLTEENRPTALATNFTYRGCGEATEDKLTKDILALLAKMLEERAAIGDKGREIVLQHYSVSRMAEDALAMYDAVLAAPLPPRLAWRYAMDVVISGYYGFNNSGDDILLRAIVDNLKASKPQLSITVLSMRPKQTRAYYGVDAVYRFNLPAVYRLLRRTNLLITGGGSVIQDETSTQSLVYYLWVINTARRLGVKNMLYANGIGPVTKPSNIERVRRTLNRVDLITLRESESRQILNEIGVTAPETHVTADPAFGLPPASEADEAVTRAVLSRLGVNGPFFCVAIRAWKNNPPNLERVVAEFADYVVDTYGYTALFIPMRPVEDTDISKRVLSLMKNDGCLFTPSAGDIDQIHGVMGLAEFVLGMRLHALIYAVGKGVPVIGLVYDPKVKRQMDAMRQPFYVPLETADAATLKQYADTIQQNRTAITRDIVEAGHAPREKAMQNAALCVELLQRV